MFVFGQLKTYHMTVRVDTSEAIFSELKFSLFTENFDTIIAQSFFTQTAV